MGRESEKKKPKIQILTIQRAIAKITTGRERSFIRLKVKVECAPCLVHRGYMEILEATSNNSLQFEAMSALTRLLHHEFKLGAVPAVLGTKRDRLIKKVTGNPDPYREKKKVSDKKALEVLPAARSLVENASSQKGRFRKACLSSIVGNVIEFDILNYTFSFDNIEEQIQRAEQELAIDEVDKFFDLTKKSKEVLYLTDNAGEIAFDTLLVHELKELGAEVKVAVKGKPIVNDATMDDAKTVGMHEVANEIVTIGTDTVGLILKECSKQFLALYESADLVVAKGMGHAETLTELDLKTPHILLLRTKCKPVAEFFGVLTERNIAKIML